MTRVLEGEGNLMRGAATLDQSREYEWSRIRTRAPGLGRLRGSMCSKLGIRRQIRGSALDRIVLVFMVLLVSTFQSSAATADLTDNLRIELDAAYRAQYFDADTEWSHLFFFGVDVHKVFSTAKGDIGTLVFQPYAVRNVNLNPAPSFFDDGNNWGLQWRIANFNLTALAKNRFNIRVGHYRLPFGLEHLTPESQGRLRNFVTIKGFRADWGGTVNGILPFGEYEFGWSRGSGNDWEAKGNPYLVTGRIGTPRRKSLILGASFQIGDVKLRNGIVERRRGGVDASYLFGRFALRGDFSIGKDDGSHRWAFLGDVSYKTLLEKVETYGQIFATSQESPKKWEETVELRAGFRVEVHRMMALSAEIQQPVEAAPGKSERPKVFMQIRFRI